MTFKIGQTYRIAISGPIVHITQITEEFVWCSIPSSSETRQFRYDGFFASCLVYVPDFEEELELLD